VSRRVSLIAGIVLILVGLVWTLQGFDILGGSAMSGVALWAVVGPFVVLVGIILVLSGRRRR
jgi:hypothetical protein